MISRLEGGGGSGIIIAKKREDHYIKSHVRIGGFDSKKGVIPYLNNPHSSIWRNFNPLPHNPQSDALSIAINLSKF